jgi:hypothetical protein
MSAQKCNAAYSIDVTRKQAVATRLKLALDEAADLSWS